MEEDKYMLLKNGDIIMPIDEALMPNGIWCIPSLSFVVNDPFDPTFHLPHRRLINIEILDLF